MHIKNNLISNGRKKITTNTEQKLLETIKPRFLKTANNEYEIK